MKKSPNYFPYEIKSTMEFSTDSYAFEDGYEIIGNYYVRKVQPTEKPDKYVKETIRIYTTRDRIPLEEQKILAERLGYTGEPVGVKKVKMRIATPEKYKEIPIYETKLKQKEVIITPRKGKEQEIWRWDTKSQAWKFVEYRKSRTKVTRYEHKKVSDFIPGNPGYIDITFEPFRRSLRVKGQIEIFYTLDYQKTERNPERHIILRYIINVTVGIKPEKGKELEWIQKLILDIENEMDKETCRRLLKDLHPDLYNNFNMFEGSREIESGGLHF